MWRAPVLLALLLAGCGASPPPVIESEGRRRVEVLSTTEVRIPADPYTPTAQAMPLLHQIGGRLCGPTYRILDRRIGRDFEAFRAYHPAFRVAVPSYRHSWAIIARIQCLRVH